MADLRVEHELSVRSEIAVCTNESGMALLIVALSILVLAIVGGAFMGASNHASWSSAYSLLNESGNRNLASNAAAAWAMKLDTAVRNGNSISSFGCSASGGAPVVDTNDTSLSYTCKSVPTGSSDSSKQAYLITALYKNATKSSYLLKSKSTPSPAPSDECLALSVPAGYDVYNYYDFNQAVNFPATPTSSISFPRSVIVQGTKFNAVRELMLGKDVTINGDLIVVGDIKISVGHNFTIHGNLIFHSGGCRVTSDLTFPPSIGSAESPPIDTSHTVTIDGNVTGVDDINTYVATGGAWYTIGIGGGAVVPLAPGMQNFAQTLSYNIGGDIAGDALFLEVFGSSNQMTILARDITAQAMLQIGTAGDSNNNLKIHARNISGFSSGTYSTIGIDSVILTNKSVASGNLVEIDAKSFKFGPGRPVSASAQTSASSNTYTRAPGTVKLVITP